MISRQREREKLEDDYFEQMRFLEELKKNLGN